jgi:hypothetical protein
MIKAHGKDSTHGKEIRRTAKQATHGKALCRAYMARRTAKNSLPCFLCRASTLGKGFAVSFLPFTVRDPRTAKHCSPVVRWTVLLAIIFRIILYETPLFYDRFGWKSF